MSEPVWKSATPLPKNKLDQPWTTSPADIILQKEYFRREYDIAVEEIKIMQAREISTATAAPPRPAPPAPAARPPAPHHTLPSPSPPAPTPLPASPHPNPPTPPTPTPTPNPNPTPPPTLLRRNVCVSATCVQASTTLRTARSSVRRSGRR